MSGLSISAQKEKFEKEIGASQMLASMMRCNQFINILNPEGEILITNMHEFFEGINEEDLIGKRPENFIAQEFRDAFKNLIKTLASDEEKECDNLESVLDINGQKIIVEGQVIKVRNKTGELIGFINSMKDITEKVEEHAKLEKSLEEKSLLTKEMSHRVINTMQVAGSLFRYYERYMGGEEDKELMKNYHNWLTSVRLVHNLYNASDLRGIDIEQYTNKTIKSLLGQYHIDRNKIKFNVDVSVSLNINTAIPCCSIINELISNAIKHAFPDEQKGEVNIELKKDGDDYVFKISDNGIGLAEGISFDIHESIGVKIVSLYAQQLDAKIDINRDNGTQVTVTFPDKKGNGFASTRFIKE